VQVCNPAARAVCSYAYALGSTHQGAQCQALLPGKEQVAKNRHVPCLVSGILQNVQHQSAHRHNGAQESSRRVGKEGAGKGTRAVEGRALGPVVGADNGARLFQVDCAEIAHHSMHTAHSHNVHIQRHAIAQHAVLEGDLHTHSGNLMPSDDVRCAALASHARAISLCTEDTRIIFRIHSSSNLHQGEVFSVNYEGNI